MAEEDLDAATLRFTDERVENAPRPVRVGEELSMLLFVEGHSQLVEELDRLLHSKGSQHPSHEAGAPAAPARCPLCPLWKSASVTTRLVTLQRPPPLTRIFAPSFRAESRTRIFRSGRRRAAKMAVASPAAPAPDDDDVSVLQCSRASSARSLPALLARGGGPSGPRCSMPRAPRQVDIARGSPVPSNRGRGRPPLATKNDLGVGGDAPRPSATTPGIGAISKTSSRRSSGRRGPPRSSGSARSGWFSSSARSCAPFLPTP